MPSLPAPWPAGAEIDASGHLRLGGIDASSLARRYGTPLYVYDAPTIRTAYAAYRAAFRPHGPARVAYAVKACPLVAVGALLARAGADASAASLGEVLAARRAGFPAGRIQLHGNAKTDDELRAALRARVGRIVVDGHDEADRLVELQRRSARVQPVWLRVSPGIDVDTHPHLRTGTLDSKFGAPIATGEALALAAKLAATRGVRLVGVHAHLGTELHEEDRYAELGLQLARLALEIHRAAGVRLAEIAVGGGLKVPLRPGERALDLERYANAVTRPIRERSELARVVVYCEPGRSLVARAGVALYRVVGTKRVPGVRTFVAVDGGMGDNIRPALYDAAYTAMLAEKADRAPEERVAIAGKYCESGDVLIREVDLPLASRDDVLAVPAVGAYALAMASNYNSFPRPAVVMVDGGHARLIRAREQHADLWRLERR